MCKHFSSQIFSLYLNIYNKYMYILNLFFVNVLFLFIKYEILFVVNVDEIENLKLEQTRLSQQCVDAQRREKILMRRLANKEQEFQDYVVC